MRENDYELVVMAELQILKNIFYVVYIFLT